MNTQVAKYTNKVISVIMALAMVLSIMSISAFAKAPTKDGKYNVSFHLWNAEKNEASMGDGFFKHTARLNVKNGKTTMTVYANTKAINQMFKGKKFVLDMRVSNGKGGWTKATATGKSKNGSTTALSFRLPNKKKYVACQVNPHVPQMGNTYVDARLKIDYGTVKAVK